MTLSMTLSIRPMAPMSAMPMKTAGMRKVSAASEIMKPSPDCAPVNSAATTTAQLSAMATFRPVKICGIAEGSTTRKKVWARVRPIDCAARW